jgi:hypothetical protein
MPTTTNQAASMRARVLAPPPGKSNIRDETANANLAQMPSVLSP